MIPKFRISLILLLALGLRWISLNQSLWLDEAIQIWAVTNYSWRDLLNSYFPGDFNPPLSYLITWISVKIFNDSEMILRLPSVILGVINVWLVYLFSKNFFSKNKTLSLNINYSSLAALFLATAPLHIYYSQEARPYILAASLVTWSMYELWSLMKNKRNNSWRYVLATSLMLYSHYMTWLLIPVHGFIFCQIYLKNKFKKANFLTKKLKFFLISWLAIGITIIFWMPTLFKQLRLSQAVSTNLPAWERLGRLTVKNLSLIPVKFLIGRISFNNDFLYGLMLSPLLLLTAWLLLRTIKRFSKSAEIIFLWSWLIGPLLLGALLSIKVAVFQYFRFLFILPAFYLLLLVGLSNLSKYWQKVIIVLFLTVNFSSSSIYLFNSKFHREDWRSLVAFIHKKQTNPKVLILKPVSAPFWYYDKGRAVLIDYLEADSFFSENSLWLVKYAQPIFEPDNKTEDKLKQYGFQEVLEKHFRGVTVKYFVNPNGLKADSQLLAF